MSINSATPGATIFYTTDGNTPTTASPVFGSPIAVAGNGTTLTIKALAVKAGMADSTVASATYTIINTQTVATPTFSSPEGTYSADQAVTINSLTTGATIYYTMDGSVPTTSSAVFTSAIPVSGNGKTMTIKALAVKAGMMNSAVSSAAYTITYTQTVATPTFSTPAGTYGADLTVTINSTTPGAAIYYTTDGSTPSTVSAVFGSPIPVSGNGTTTTIRALAAKSGMTDSAVASATYVINSGSVVFSYPPNSSSGGLIQSSRVSPNGSDQDMYAYKDFTLASAQSIREIDWRGGYLQGAAFGHVTGFTLTLYASIAGGSQPAVTRPDTTESYLAQYTVNGNAGETPAGSVNGIAMYDYKFVLPTPFQAAAGTKYWLRIEASQNTFPDWGIAVGTGGSGAYFRFSTGLAAFTMIPGGDTAFSLLK